MHDATTRNHPDLVLPAPGRYDLDDALTHVGFRVMHMTVSPVRGRFAGHATVHVDDDPADSSVSATIDAASVTTRNPARDAHLRSPDFLDVDRHPTIEFRSTHLDRDATAPAAPRPPRRRRRRPATVARFALHGDLTIRGITRPVVFDAEIGETVTGGDGRPAFAFSASGDVDREQFGLLWNVALESGGVLVARTVRIELAGRAVRADT